MLNWERALKNGFQCNRKNGIENFFIFIRFFLCRLAYRNKAIGVMTIDVPSGFDNVN